MCKMDSVISLALSVFVIVLFVTAGDAFTLGRNQLTEQLKDVVDSQSDRLILTEDDNIQGEVKSLSGNDVVKMNEVLDKEEIVSNNVRERVSNMVESITFGKSRTKGANNKRLQKRNWPFHCTRCGGTKISSDYTTYETNEVTTKPCKCPKSGKADCTCTV